MKNIEKEQETYDKLITDYVNSQNDASSHLLEMAHTIADAKERLSRKMYKRFLEDSKVNLKRLQANKMIAVYDLSKSDSRLTQIFNTGGIEKAYLITTIKDNKAMEKFLEEITDTSFTVKQTRQAVQKINTEGKTPAQAIEEVQNKIITSKPKESSPNVPFAVYEKSLREIEILRREIEKLKKQLESAAQKNKSPKNQTRELSGQRNAKQVRHKKHRPGDKIEEVEGQIHLPLSETA